MQRLFVRLHLNGPVEHGEISPIVVQHVEILVVVKLAYGL